MLKQPKALIKGLDIFCGAGGSSAGARKAGVEMVGAIDMSALAIATYKKNFPSTNAFAARLEKINLNSLKRQIGEIDILLASPECTDHTCAKGSGIRRESSRATAMEAVRFARFFRPRWIVIENVVHMRPWSRYEELKDRLRKIGYHLAEQVLNSADFGVAQTRKRLFLVGDLKKEPGLVKLNRRGQQRPVHSILDRPGKWKSRPLMQPCRAKGTLERAQRAFEALGSTTGFLLVYYSTDGGGGWQPLARPLRTITTIDRFALVSPSKEGPMIRMLQVDELKRAMGHRTGFLLPYGTRRDRIRLLGNGVCPPVMARVIHSLITGIPRKKMNGNRTKSSVKSNGR
jgi:DNA (cytosine-5)-methyltransferase 1